MEFSVSLPLDGDGFLRRQCPHCEQEFKWHYGTTDEAPSDWVDPPVYCCPLCGRAAPPDQWWTRSQNELVEQTMAGPALDLVQDELKRAFRDMPGATFTASNTNEVAPLDPLVEPDDMVIISSPCHPWEPMKVTEIATPPFYCLMCGEAFAA